jgi:hypothetical protein
MKSLSQLTAFLKPYLESITLSLVALVHPVITGLSIVQILSFSFGTMEIKILIL